MIKGLENLPYDEMLKNYRIMKWFGLEGNLKIIQFHSPAMGRSSFLQTRLTCPYLLSATCLSASTITVKNFFLISYLNLPVFSLKPLTLFSLQIRHCIAVQKRLATKKMEPLSSQGIAWKRQGRTGKSCIERGFISIQEQIFYNENHQSGTAFPGMWQIHHSWVFFKIQLNSLLTTLFQGFFLYKRLDQIIRSRF